MLKNYLFPINGFIFYFMIFRFADFDHFVIYNPLICLMSNKHLPLGSTVSSPIDIPLFLLHTGISQLKVLNFNRSHVSIDYIKDYSFFN